MDLHAFDGVKRLYGETPFLKIINSHVAIIGLGGVGSWAAESIARCGVQKITLVDLDDICSSNINRQIIADTTTIGKLKAEVMQKRLEAINPAIKVNCIFDFYSYQSSEEILNEKYNCIIDCIDSVSNKALLASKCREKNIPLVTVGAASGKKDPTKIMVKDLNFSFNDRLLFQVRKVLKRKYFFTRSKKEPFNIISIFSPEDGIENLANDSNCNKPNENDLPKKMHRFSCQNGPGTSAMVTASFGLIAANEAINIVLNQSDHLHVL